MATYATPRPLEEAREKNRHCFIRVDGDPSSWLTEMTEVERSLACWACWGPNVPSLIRSQVYADPYRLNSELYRDDEHYHRYKTEINIFLLQVI